MSKIDGVEFGPLALMIGVWKGAEGVDVAPEPDGSETNPFFETITNSVVGGVTNAGEQNLAAIHYHKIVQRKSNGDIFHNETGYWMWDQATNIIMHSLSIPRAVCVLAGGTYNGETDGEGRAVIKVSAKIDDEKWKIIQSPFMADKASTVAFSEELTVGNGTMTYCDTTMVDIYGQVFEHTDENTLVIS
ncbi:MAG: FABP family protein [Rhodospirillales bacterium]|nr:FABP family protein [Rhodospirillales bacterium]